MYKKFYEETLEDMRDEMDRLVFAPWVNFKWYRKWCGGHWERWTTPDCGHIWCQVDYCYKDLDGRRPAFWCRGTPTCEHYEEKK